MGRPFDSEPFTPTHMRARARKAWASVFACGCKVGEDEKECPTHKKPPLEPIGLHECRHTFVSLMHDAGLSLERIGDYVGHSSAFMTDRYRHLLEGHEKEAADILDAYLAKRTGAQTGAQPLAAVAQPASLRGI